MDEIGVLIDRAMLQIINAMRHIELNEAGHNAIRRVDQLTRSLEYLCDVEEYNKKIEKKLHGMLKSNREQKKLIREFMKGDNPELEGFDSTFAVYTKSDKMKVKKLYRCSACGDVITDEDWETDPQYKHIGRCYCRLPTTDENGKRLSMREIMQQDTPFESLCKFDVYVIQSSRKVKTHN